MDQRLFMIWDLLNKKGMFSGGLWQTKLRKKKDIVHSLLTELKGCEQSSTSFPPTTENPGQLPQLHVNQRKTAECPAHARTDPRINFQECDRSWSGSVSVFSKLKGPKERLTSLANYPVVWLSPCHRYAHNKISYHFAHPLLYLGSLLVL